MSDVLASIIEGVRADEAARQLSKRELQDRLSAAPSPIDALAKLRAREFSVVAEVKRSSPSKGELAEIAAPEILAAKYQEGGAGAISVLTEQRRFKGSLADLAAVRAQVQLPLLRKDFLVSEYAVYESRAWGADLVLLIVAALDDRQLVDFHQIARGLGMRVLVEVHSQAELERALNISPEIVGVNARNLRTLEVSTEAFRKMIPLIPAGIYRIAESGIRGAADAKFARSCGADGILVGESLVRAAEPITALRELLSVTP